MDFVVLREEEYEKFVLSHELGSFVQSSATAKRSQAAGWQTYFVGVRGESGEVAAAAMLTARDAFNNLSIYDIANGPLMDYDNQKLVAFFFAELNHFLRRRNAMRVRISPPLLMNHRDRETNILQDGYDGTKYIEALKSAGLTHVSSQATDSNPQMQRWYAAKDLSRYSDAKSLINSFDYEARRAIAKAQHLGVVVKSYTIDQLDEFYDVFEHASAKRVAELHDKQYYRDLAKSYGKNIHFCVAQLDFDRHEALLMKQLGELTTQIASLSPKARNKDKLRELNAAKTKARYCRSKLATIGELRKEGSVVNLAGAIFIQYGRELTYFTGRSYEKYVAFGAPYVLQWQAQYYAIKNGITRFSFHTTRGNFSGNPKQHGAFRFKKGLGAIVEERIGYFEMYPYASKSNLLATGRGGATMMQRARMRQFVVPERTASRGRLVTASVIA